ISTGSVLSGRQRDRVGLRSRITIDRAEEGSNAMVRVPTDGAPTHPGEMLEEEFLKPLGLSQTELAAKLGVSSPRVNGLVHGKRGVTPDTEMQSEHLIRLESPFCNLLPFEMYL